MDAEKPGSPRSAIGLPRSVIVALVLAIAAVVIYGEFTGRDAPSRKDAPAVPPAPISSPAGEVPAAQTPRETVTQKEPLPQQTAASASPAQGAEEIFTRVAPRIVVVEAFDSGKKRIAQGSGVVADRGYVVTNRHVVERADEILVRQGGRSYAARVRYADREYDLCGLSVDSLQADPVFVGSLADLRTGQRVYAVGAPYGLEMSLSEGVISSLRPVAGGTNLIQTTAAVSKGSSGGGLFDGQGRLVGITTFIIREGQNLNFALPAEMIANLPARSADIRSLPFVVARPGDALPGPSAEAAARARELLEAINEKRSGLIAQEKEKVRMKSEFDQAVLALQQMETTLAKHRMAGNLAAHDAMMPEYKARFEELKEMEQRYKDRQLDYLERVNTLNRMVAEYNALAR